MTPIAFTSFTLRNTVFRNRLIVSPMCQYQAVAGRPVEWHFDHHARLALGGIGGAIVEATAIAPEGRITPACLGIWNDDQVDDLARIAAIYHRQGIAVGIQLAHAGRKASCHRPWEGGGPLEASAPAGSGASWRAVAPSPLPYDAGWPVPASLSADAIARLVEGFAAAARRARLAEFDFIEIHGAHGYLLHSFLSPVSNRRQDGYGGDLTSRMRLALEVTEAVRAAWPADRALFYRASCVDEAPGGLEIADTIVLAGSLMDRGVDCLDCSSGGISGATTRYDQPREPGFQVPYAAVVREQARIPTMAVGLIDTPRQVQQILARGQADLIALGRTLLADSNFAYRVARELEHPDPESVLPKPLGFYLQRQAQRAGRQ